MKILVLNGPNLNLLGLREPEIYGKEDYPALCRYIEDAAKAAGAEATVRQSNHEGVLVDELQAAYGRYDAIVMNPAAYTHTSIAILDALKAVGLPTVEVHLSDVSAREDFRQVSYIGLYAEKRIMGRGFEGYKAAIDYLVKVYKK